MRDDLDVVGKPDVVVRRTGVLLAGLVVLALASAACAGSQPVLLQLMEARRLASDLRTTFTKANEASNRAGLADTDDVSAAAAKEAADATAAAAAALKELEAKVQALGYDAEGQILQRLRPRFEEFQKLDAEILSLAVENTNLKAQRLSFGAARELGEQIGRELEVSAAGGPAEFAAQAHAVRADVFELLFLQARHNAEAEDAAMTALEQHAATLAGDARQRFARMQGKGNQAALDAALSLFTRFMATHDEVIALSRRNTNVRSLALTLGRKRVVAADCEAELARLHQLLEGHGSEATR